MRFLLLALAAIALLMLPTQRPEFLGPIHWHAALTITIDGKNVTIPAGVGITVGKNIENEISGFSVAPMHTHDATGILHVENEDPDRWPDRTQLGYFFHIWGQLFDERCVMDRCASSGEVVTMTVNGARNNEYGDYYIKDGDRIEIRLERRKI